MRQLSHIYPSESFSGSLGLVNGCMCVCVCVCVCVCRCVCVCVCVHADIRVLQPPLS